MATTTAPKTAPIRLLVADHDQARREQLGCALESFGFEAVLIGSMLDLLGCAPGPRPSALILDYRFQGLDGLDLRSRLLRHGIDLPVIFTSGPVEVGTAVRAIKAGAIDFLVRPFKEEDLAEAICAALEADTYRKRRASEENELQSLYRALTPREREVLSHVTSGLMNKQVAWRLGLSEITVKVHRGQVMRKMKVRSFAELVTKANMLRGAGVLDDDASSREERVPAAYPAAARLAPYAAAMRGSSAHALAA